MLTNNLKFRKIKSILALVIILLLSGGITSCRSHNKKEKAHIGETIERPKGKKDHSMGQKVADEVMTWIGTPYSYGCSEKGKSTDCSGMVMVVYQEVTGIKLPRNSAKQAEFCHHVHHKDIKPGDLVFFATGKDRHKVSHVGIMIDHHRFVHASSSKGVMISEIKSSYWQKTFIKYGRVPR